MKKHNIIEIIVHKVSEKLRPVFAPIRIKKLNNTDFTVISNNCWGGKVYEFFGLEKKSPTIGSYFFADDYIKFIYNLKHYLTSELKIITAQDSKHYDELKRRGQLDIPIGKLDDIEIVFLHYKDPNVAKQKFERRCKRINWDNLIIKFSYMNNCTEEILEKFSKIKGVKKILFIGKDNKKYKDSYIIPTAPNGQIEDDVFYWKKYINIYEIINKTKTSINELYIEK